MVFFKKKVRLIDYCRKKYDYIFSNNGKQLMDKIAIDGGVSVGEDLKDNYYSNFIAAYFELMEIAFSRKLSRDLRYEALDISDEYLKEKNASSIKSLVRAYNSAFGSSFEDGIIPMAKIMANNISGKPHAETYFHGVFYGIIEAFNRDLKKVKIIA